MDATQLTTIELAIHDWNALREATGSARGVPDALQRLFSAKSTEEAEAAYWQLENHVVVQGQLFECAVAVTHVLMAALVTPDRPSFVRIGLLELLFQIVAGESDSMEAARGLNDLGARCREAARSGLWLLYREMTNGQMKGAREVIALLERDPRRLEVMERSLG